jgi:hypothetical protein
MDPRPGSHPVTVRLVEITFAMRRRGGVEDEWAVQAFRRTSSPAPAARRPFGGRPITDRHCHTGLRWQLAGIRAEPAS